MITLIPLNFISVWLSNGWYRNYLVVLNFYKCKLSALYALLMHLHLIVICFVNNPVLKNTFDFFSQEIYFQASSTLTLIFITTAYLANVTLWHVGKISYYRYRKWSRMTEDNKLFKITKQIKVELLLELYSGWAIHQVLFSCKDCGGLSTLLCICRAEFYIIRACVYLTLISQVTHTCVSPRPEC